MVYIYPKAIFCIILTEFCERFSFCGLRTILSLYLRNELLVPENDATIVYHVFIMLCYIGPLIGAFLADGYLGRFRTILYFSFVYLIGNVVMCLAATPPLKFPPLTSTIIGLILIAMGTGGIKPCVAAFGGDQFFLPQEEGKLQSFFSWFYFAINTGGLAGMLATPALRKSVTCFGDDTCYSLGFGFPAGLMILALIAFVAGKPCYKIRSPKENMLSNFFRCTYLAIRNKYNAKAEEKKEHWLDYAEKNCGKKLVSDMKILYAIILLYVPLPLFWSLFDQQGSRWTFQASRTNGTMHFLGKSFTILPDQMQVVNPAIVLIMIPIFERMIYPSCAIMQYPLKRMVFGGLAAGSAFIASGLLELELQKNYPEIPPPGSAALNIINTLDCGIFLKIYPEADATYKATAEMKPHEMTVFRNLTTFNVTQYVCEVEASARCKDHPSGKQKAVYTIKQTEVHTILIGKKDEGRIFLYITDPIDFSKSMNGKPRLRLAYMHGANDLRNVTVTLKNEDSANIQDVYFVADAPRNYFSLSSYMDLPPGRYSYEVKSSMDFIHENGKIYLELGGVYTLVIREYKGDIDFTGFFTMTLPNSVHMLWLLPQYFLISIGEIMFAISGLEFSFCQAPKSMKAIIIASWYLTVALGNFLVILITQANFFKKQSYEFFLFAVLIFVDMALFFWMTLKYVNVPLEPDDSLSVKNDSDGEYDDEEKKIEDDSSAEEKTVLKKAEEKPLLNKYNLTRSYSKKDVTTTSSSSTTSMENYDSQISKKKESIVLNR